jgi:hypothetical protein
MKTDELMRKDWLFYKGKFNAFSFQVEQITKKKIGYYAEPNENKMYYLHPSEIYPIPLTKEIVLQCFEVNHQVMQFHIEQCKVENPEWLFLTYKDKHFEYVLCWEASLYNDGFSLFIYDCPLPEIHYVHELQHFLKLCGINKEITL